MSTLKVNQIVPFNDFGVGVGAANSESSALFNIKSTTQGVLFPSMTTAQRDSIAAPKDGLIIYNVDAHAYEHYNSATPAWESIDGVQSLNTLTTKNQFLATGFAGLAPNWVSAIDTHTLNIPMANTTAVTAGLVSKGEWDSFNTRLFPVKNIKYVVKSSSLGPQDYNSVKDALDSITDASAVNPYVILVGPGVFSESQLQMKEFVILLGYDDSCSIIEAANPSVPLLIGHDNSEIKSVKLVGPTDPGVPLIYYTGTSLSLASFSVVECAFENASIVYKIENSDDFVTVFRTEGCRIPSSSDVDNVMTVGGIASKTLFVYFDNFIYRRLSSPYPTSLFEIAGSNARVVMDKVFVETNSSSSDGVLVSDGATVGVVNSLFSGLNIGLHVQNVGAPPQVQTSNFILKGCVQDILIEHPGTTGSINGASDINKVFVDDAATVTLSMVDPVNGGTFDTGPLSLGRNVSTLTNVSDLLEGEPGMGIITGGFLSDEGSFDVGVSAGFGYIQATPFPNHSIRRIEWAMSTITLSANQDVYVYVNSSGNIVSAASIGNTVDIILIGRVVTNSAGIELIDQSPLLSRHAVNFINRVFREGFGSIYDSGSIVTENATPFKIDITAGTYFFSFNRYTPIGATAATFTEYYRDGVGGYNRASTDLVNNTSYDGGTGTLAPLSSGFYAKHTVYINCDDADEKYFVVLGQAEYSALAAVESAPLPTPPSWIKDAVTPIASIVVKEGDANIVEFLDIRPVIGFKSSGVSASADHGNLLGLSDDDHPQYLLVSGSRAMVGDLNMGGNDINSVATVDGVVVSAHASRHLPSGADPLATAAPAVNLSATTTNAVGTANSLSRSDHGHAISTGTPSSQVPDQSNAAGSSANLARADHIHNVPTAAPSGTIGANSTNGQGVAATFSRADHQHQVATGTPSSQVPDQSNAAGSSANLARADHIHAIPTAIPVSVAGANAQGSAATFARSDHVHAHGAQTNPAQHAIVTTIANGFMSSTDKTKLDGIEAGATNSPLTNAAPADVTKAVAAVGVSTEAARADHKHDIVTAVAVDITDSTNSEGSSTSLSRADHGHAHGNRGGGSLHADVTTSVSGFMSATDKTKLNGIEAGATNTPLTNAAPLNITKSAAAVGTSVEVARADHKHDITTAAAIELTDSTNAEGSSTSLSRADHGHAHGNRGGGTLHAEATTSVSGFLSAVDKTKVDNLVLQRYLLTADSFENPNNANWTVNALAPIATDSLNAGLNVRQFVDGSQTGVGFTLEIPPGATNMTMKFRTRRLAGAVAQVVQLSLFRRPVTVDAALPAWSAANTFTLAIAAGPTIWRYHTQTVSLSTLGITADSLVQFELTRNGAAGADTLTATWNLLGLVVEFT